MKTLNIRFLLAIAVVVFLTVNVVLLGVWHKEVIAVQEEFKPAEIKAIVIIDKNCLDCFDASLLLSFLQENLAAEISDKEEIDYDSEEGRTLIENNNLSQLPAILITGETEKLLRKAPFLDSFGGMADGVFVTDELPAPYIEIRSGEVRGRYTLTYLTDVSCDECYDVSIHRQILEGLTAVPFEERSIDRNGLEGQSLIVDYNIKNIPTIILNGELDKYEGFQEIWENIGTIEKDGVYVFREVGLMGPYFNLETGKIETQQ